MAAAISLPVDSRLKISGLTVVSSYVGEGAIGAFTFSNSGIFPHSDAFGVLVIAYNGEGYPIVVARGQAWASGTTATLGAPDYVAANPGQSISLAGGQYVGLVMRSAPIPTNYVGQTLYFVVAESSANVGAAVGTVAPYAPTAWLSKTFVAKTLGSSIGVTPGGTITTTLPTSLPTPTPASSTPTPAPTPTTTGGGGGTGTQTGGTQGLQPSQTQQTAPSTGFWASLPTLGKVGIIGGGGALLVGGYFLATGRK